MSTRFAVTPNELDYSIENMAILAASILVSILQKEDADCIRIKSDEETYIFRRVK